MTDIKQKLDNKFSRLACLQVNFRSAKLNAGNPILFKLRSDIKIRFCSTSEVEELNMLFCWLENVLLQLHISLIERFLELLRTGMIEVL